MDVTIRSCPDSLTERHSARLQRLNDRPVPKFRGRQSRSLGLRTQLEQEVVDELDFDVPSASAPAAHLLPVAERRTPGCGFRRHPRQRTGPDAGRRESLRPDPRGRPAGRPPSSPGSARRDQVAVDQTHVVGRDVAASSQRSHASPRNAGPDPQVGLRRGIRWAGPDGSEVDQVVVTAPQHRHPGPLAVDGPAEVRCTDWRCCPRPGSSASAARSARRRSRGSPPAARSPDMNRPSSVRPTAEGVPGSGCTLTMSKSIAASTGPAAGPTARSGRPPDRLSGAGLVDGRIRGSGPASRSPPPADDGDHGGSTGAPRRARCTARRSRWDDHGTRRRSCRPGRTAAQPSGSAR